MTDGYALVGRIRKPHGIHGEFVVDIVCDEPDAIFASGRRLFIGDASGTFSESAEQVTVRRSRPFKNAMLLVLSHVHDRNAAELWRERCIYVPMNELPPLAEGEVRVYELTGMRVDDVHGAHVGEVVGVDQLPQGLLLTVATSRGNFSVPFVAPIVANVDRGARTIVIDPPSGLLEP